MNESRRPTFIHVHDHGRSLNSYSSSARRPTASPNRKKSSGNISSMGKRRISPKSNSKKRNEKSLLSLCYRGDWEAVQSRLECLDEPNSPKHKQGRSQGNEDDTLQQVMEYAFAACAVLNYNRELIVRHLLIERRVQPTTKAVCAAFRCNVSNELWELMLLNINVKKVLLYRDNDSMVLPNPINHLITLIGSVVDCDARFLEYFKVYIDTIDCKLSPTDKKHYSPLIPVLSMITNDQSYLFSNLDIMVEAATFILEKSPDRVQDFDPMTGCTALHIALRMAGNKVDFIQLLLDLDTSNQHLNLRTRNVFGDLPLHVACAAGVPQPILQAILERMLCLTDPSPLGEPHPMIWSPNNEGHSAIDLEWMRHIEGGESLLNQRCFSTLAAQGIQTRSTSCSQIYRKLLEKAVEEVLVDEAPLEGGIFERMKLIIQFATGNKSDGLLLHSLSSMVRLGGPSLPLPLLKLFYHYNRDQVQVQDSKGRLPLHYALMKSDKAVNTPPGQFSGTDHHDWIQLLATGDTTVRVCDDDGRLAVHHALSHGLAGDSISCELLQFTKEKSVEDLVKKNPVSLELRDPISRLFPFQQAAAANFSIHSIYQLLRSHPTAAATKVKQEQT